MTFLELCLSGACDAFGHPFRNWDVVGWEQGRVPEDYVCWLYCEWEPRPTPAVMRSRQVKQQMELFA
jgi:hypothetical protein